MGVAPARLVGGSLRAVAEDEVVAVLEAALKGETGVYEGSFHVANGRGAAAPDDRGALAVTLRVSPLRSADGGVSGGQGVVADVTSATVTSTASTVWLSPTWSPACPIAAPSTAVCRRPSASRS